MSAKILSGKIAREALAKKLIKKIQSLSSKPTLAIIQVGNRADSNDYIRAKKSLAEKIGVEVKHKQVSEDISQGKLVELIQQDNKDKNVNGIILQLPLPKHLTRDLIINTIDPVKDVDGLTSVQMKTWMEGKKNAIWPATARGVKELLNYYSISLSGKRVVVVGRSDLVGKPIAAMCQNAGALVSVCHSQTVDLAKETKNADIIIVAVGKPKLIGREHVREGQIIIDVGINKTSVENIDDEMKKEEVKMEKLVGDVDFKQVKNIVRAITPVPGGVGPMTVLALFENLVDLVYNKPS